MVKWSETILGYFKLLNITTKFTIKSPKCQRRNIRENINGFTLVEIVAALAIIGIMSAVAITRISSSGTRHLMLESALIKSHLRYAQSRAMNDIVPWGITFGGSSYTLTKNGVAASSNLPNEDSSTHMLKGGITVSGTSVSFDIFGNPGVATLSIIVSIGANSQVITVTRNTGFIP